jgi:glycosyltransferase involved in cell wall biosynthesis
MSILLREFKFASCMGSELSGNRKERLQQWARLDLNPTAEVLVFVGRWSAQKGIDIIADVAPILLNDYPAVQIIAVGPIVDLLGKFAALKFEMLRQMYRGRIFTKTEFIAIPPFMNTFVSPFTKSWLIIDYSTEGQILYLFRLAMSPLASYLLLAFHYV